MRTRSDEIRFFYDNQENDYIRSLTTMAYSFPTEYLCQIGLAFLHPEDKFNKKFGREIASQRLLNQPMIIPYNEFVKSCEYNPIIKLRALDTLSYDDLKLRFILKQIFFDFIWPDVITSGWYKTLYTDFTKPIILNYNYSTEED